MNRTILRFLRGVRDGSPIGAGYFAVSFAFGIQAREALLTIFQTGLLSGTNLTSAGQFAGLSVIEAGASLLTMALTQLVINLRYCLMSCALSQRLAHEASFWHRFLIACGVTDEIFAVSIASPGPIRPAYFYGLTAISWPGWVGGSLLGAFAGDLLPVSVTHALTMALYAMFVAIVVPAAKSDRRVLGAALTAIALSTACAFAPWVKTLSEGMRIVVVTLIVAGAAATFFPLQEASDAH